jgi:hypothetical protein
LTFPTPRLHVSGIRTCLGKELDQRAIYATLMLRPIRKVLSGIGARCRVLMALPVGSLLVSRDTVPLIRSVEHRS